MGSGFDYFGLKSHPDYQNPSFQSKANRLLLRKLMIDNGFKPIEQEWWHFTLADEPYLSTNFDFSLK